jgi:hypothetical protein
MENSTLNLNASRSDKFIFVLSDIPSLSRISVDNDNELERNLENKEAYDNFMLGIHSVEIPGMNHTEQKISTPFSPISVGSMTVEFDALVTEIKIDANFFTYKVIHTWMNMIKNPFGFNETQINDTESNLYVDGTIMVNDNMDNRSILAFDFVDLHPISLPSLSMDYRTNDEMTISVTWGYTSYDLVDNRGTPILKDK